jgi:site-specific recombinase XerC
MPRHGKRRKIATNIYADENGISGVVRLRGVRDELRFPIGTALAEIRRQMQARRDELDEDVPESVVRGSVRHYVEKFTRTLGDSTSDEERKQRLATWVTALGEKRFNTVTRGELEDTIARWRKQGKSASTIAKRISSLRQVWKRYAPERATPHPIETIQRPREPRAAIRARPIALVQEVLAELEPINQSSGALSKAAARIHVLAMTGQPPALLQQLQPHDVNWSKTPPEMYVRPRRKGEGVDAGWIVLLPQAAMAVKHFFDVGAQGAWNKGVIRRAWRVAIARAQRKLRKASRDDAAALLEGMRVYDLRHSLLTALGTATRDLHAVSQYARHSDIRTTMRYLGGAADERMRAGILALAAQLPEMSPPVSSPPITDNTARKRTKRENAAQGRTSKIPGNSETARTPRKLARTRKKGSTA